MAGDFEYTHKLNAGELLIKGDFERDRKLVTFREILTEKGEDILDILDEVAPKFIESLCKKIEEEYEDNPPGKPDFMDRNDD